MEGASSASSESDVGRCADIDTAAEAGGLDGPSAAEVGPAHSGHGDGHIIRGVVGTLETERDTWELSGSSNADIVSEPACVVQQGSHRGSPWEISTESAHEHDIASPIVPTAGDDQDEHACHPASPFSPPYSGTATPIAEAQPQTAVDLSMFKRRTLVMFLYVTLILPHVLTCSDTILGTNDSTPRMHVTAVRESFTRTRLLRCFWLMYLVQHYARGHCRDALGGRSPFGSGPCIIGCRDRYSQSGQCCMRHSAQVP